MDDLSTKPDNAQISPETIRKGFVAEGATPAALDPEIALRDSSEAKIQHSYTVWSAASVIQTAKSAEKAAEFIERHRGVLPVTASCYANSCVTAANVMRDMLGEIEALKRDEEQFDAEKPRDARQEALLALVVLTGYGNGKGPMTPADALRVADAMRLLLSEHDGQKRDKEQAEQRLERTEEARDRLLAAGALAIDLADHKTDPGLLRAEAAERALADMTAERDAAAENARRERDRRGVYTDADLAMISTILRSTLCNIGTGMLSTLAEEGDRKRRVIVENVLRAAGMRTQTEAKPLVRVVTSPRFYSDEQAKAACEKLCDGMNENFRAGAIIEGIAEALGMRKAAQ